jgi:hypothetical protein
MLHSVGTNVPLAIAPVYNFLPILERASNQLASWPLRVNRVVLATRWPLPIYFYQRTFSAPSAYLERAKTGVAHSSKQRLHSITSSASC